MSLKSSLMSYVNSGRLKSFSVYDEKKADLYLVNGRSLRIYMPTQYIVGEADVWEAAEEPAATHLIYNVWDNLGHSASLEAARLGIDIFSFGAFSSYLDRLNATP